MALLGRGALAMWWNMAPDLRAEFVDWHTREHFPERLALPGFRRASRWADAAGGEGFFVLYELRERDDLASPEYLARLNAPTPWSRRMMPHHRDMVRSQCVVVESHGASSAGHLLTVRFSPAGDSLGDETIRRILDTHGVVGAHLLKTDAPAVPPTTEQRIRGNADRAADWILLVAACEGEVLAQVAPFLPQGVVGTYTLSLAALATDVADRAVRTG